MYTLNSEISERVTRSFEGNIWIGNENYSVLHRKSFRIFISRVWNELPTEIKLVNTVSTFKEKIKELFLSKTFKLPLT